MFQYIRNISTNAKSGITSSRYAPSNSVSAGSGSHLSGAAAALRSDSAMALVGTTEAAAPPPHFQFQQQRYHDFAIDS